MIGYNPIDDIATGRTLDIQVEGAHDATHLKKLLRKINLIPLKSKQMPGSCNWILQIQPTRKTSEFQLRGILSKIHSARIISY